MLYYDLHLHSCLSPCADDDMSPANVCAMARLKGLDLIALTDHNTTGNLAAFQQAATREGLLFLPGMELCTREEVHLLAYFPDLESALAFGDCVKKHLPPTKNNKAVFGSQLLMDSEDKVLGEEEALLIGASSLGLDAACDLVRSLGGVAVPAHIYRGYGLVQALGFIPQETGFTTLELLPGEVLPPGYQAIHSSDAHQLGMISERVHLIDCQPQPQAVVRWLDGQNIHHAQSQKIREDGEHG